VRGKLAVAESQRVARSAEETPQLLQPLLRRLRLVQPPLTHAQLREIRLLELQLEHVFLKAIFHNEARARHLALLPQAVHAIDGLRFGRGVELRLHDVDLRARGEVQAEAAGGQGDEEDGGGGVVAEGVEGGVALLAGHGAVQADVREASVGEGDLDEVEVGGPAGEDDGFDGGFALL